MSEQDFIGRVDRFIDAQGRLVEQITCVSGERPPQVAEFTGSVTINFQTPMGNREIPLRFSIPAKSVVEAFTNFQEEAELAAKHFVERKRKEAMDAQQSIILPGQG